LIILNKEFQDLDALGFLIKKRISAAIQKVPLFLIGDFNSKEIVDFKKENVVAFLSVPINPYALYERICMFLNIPVPPPKKTTPMLLDIHVKGNIFIVQIEGNLEPEKLELFNYLFRCFCMQKKIVIPKIFLIIPSLYPESVTPANINALFKFMTFGELTIRKHNVRILTANKVFVDEMKKIENLADFVIVRNYLQGMNDLQIDFDKVKKVPVDFLKVGSMYVFDLYDKYSQRHIPARTTVTQEMLDKLARQEIKTLTYYSDKEIVEVGDDLNNAVENSPQDINTETMFAYITSDFEPLETKFANLEVWDEKRNLFFRNISGKSVLLISKNEEIHNLIDTSLGAYFKIGYMKEEEQLTELLSTQDFIAVFIDADATYNSKTALELLCQIRTVATRRKTSVLILTSKIDMASAIKYRDSGTDNIILSPFTTSKVLQKVYSGLSEDRKK
jgi:CheY-like chemotaxis protein